MSTLTKLAATTALISATAATTALAGGMEVGRFDPAFLYEEGNYAEISYSSRSPSVTDDVYAPDGSMLSDFSTMNGALKINISDRLSVGLTSFDAGRIALSYEGSGGPFAAIPYAELNPALAALGNLPEPNVDLSFRSTAAVLKYSVTDRIDVYGGVKYTEGSATGNIITPVPGNITADSASATSAIVGASYSIPDIALRVAVTYQTAARTSHDTTSDVLGPQVASMSGMPESLTVDFQTGIAANTLLFGSIHHAKWADSNIEIGGVAVSTWDNTTSFSMGVGRKINDNWSVSGSFNYEAASEDSGTSLLSTTDGNQGVSLGARYSRDNMTVSLGANYTQFGDKTVTSLAGPGAFTDNSIMTYGVKVGFKF